MTRTRSVTRSAGAAPRQSREVVPAGTAALAAQARSLAVGGAHKKAICRQLGISFYRLKRLARTHGIEIPSFSARRRFEPWFRDWDWRRPNRELAPQMGLTLGRVSQLRCRLRALGFPVGAAPRWTLSPAERRQRGLCPGCGGERDDGRVRCSGCRRHGLEVQQALRKRRFAAGQCLRCDAARESGGSYCARHRAQRIAASGSRRRRLLRDGRCISCGRRRGAGSSRCVDCLAGDAQGGKRRADERRARGRCVQCGRKALKGHRKCAAHLAARRAWNKGER